MCFLTVLEAKILDMASLGQNQGAGMAPVFPEFLGEDLILASPGLWWLQAFLGLCPHRSNLSLCGHMAFSYSFSQISLCLSLTGHRVHMQSPPR